MTYEELQHLLIRANHENANGSLDEAEKFANKLLAKTQGYIAQGVDSNKFIEMTVTAEQDVYLNKFRSLRAKAIFALAQAAMRRGNFEDALGYAESAIAIGDAYSIPEIKPKAWNICGNVYLQLGSYDKSLDYFEKALRLFDEMDDKYDSAIITGNIGNVYQRLGDFHKVVEYQTRALAMYQELANKPGLARVMANLGLAYTNLGNFDEALECLHKALAYNIELNSKPGIASVTGSIGNVYLHLGSYDKAIEQFTTALGMYRESGEKPGIARMMTNLGLVYTHLGSYDKALAFFQEALQLHESRKAQTEYALVIGNIGSVYASLGTYTTALEYFHQALLLHRQLGEQSRVANMMGNIGMVFSKLGNNDQAMDYFRKTLDIHQSLGEKLGVATITASIGTVCQNCGKYDKALEYYQTALEEFSALGEKSGTAGVLGSIGGVYADAEYEGYNATIAEEMLLNAISVSNEIGAKAMLVEHHKTLAEFYKHEHRWQDFAVHFTKFYEVEKEVLSDSIKKTAENYDRERREAEREKVVSIARARAQATDDILANMLPSTIVERLIQGEKKIADSHEEVSVLFVDIVGFTELTLSISAAELIDLLDVVFTRFDTICKANGLEKIKTIGDAYMAVCGAPISCGDHAYRTARAALDMLEDRSLVEYFPKGINLNFRIGLHTGSVVAGIIGQNKYSYDLWGDAVNTASRMESHGEPGKIHVSEEFKHAVETLHATSLHAETLQATSLQFIRRGEMEIKGKGTMNTYFLEKT